MLKFKGSTFLQMMWVILMVAIILVAGVLIISEPAHAATVDNTAVSNSDSVSVSDSVSSATQGNGNAQNVIFNTAAQDRVTIRTTPQVYAPSMNATAPCRIAVSMGLSVVGFGAAGGGSVEDELCTMRENARFLQALGQQDAAIRLFCADKHAAIALGKAYCPLRNLESAEGPEQLPAVVAPPKVEQPVAGSWNQVNREVVFVDRVIKSCPIKTPPKYPKKPAPVKHDC